MGGTPEIFNTNNPDHRVFAMLYTFYARFGVPSQTNKGKRSLCRFNNHAGEYVCLIA